MYTTTGNFVPNSIRNLVIITTLIALFAALTEPFFNQLFKMNGLESLLSLSWYGLNSFYLWQPFTYMFVEGGGGITLFFLIRLFFDMYLLWTIGSSLVGAVGSYPFLRFYFTTGILAALLAWVVMDITYQRAIIAGPFPSIFAVLLVWSMFYPEQEITFFLFTLKAKWLLAFSIAAVFLINISQLNWVNLSLYGGALVVGYLYATTAWGLSSPFGFTKGLDAKLSRVGHFFRQKFQSSTTAKIFDIKTGKPALNDEEFVDAMLAKIAKKGENSLSWQEKKRLDAISKNKKNK